MEQLVFNRFRDIIYTKSGIVLSPEKKSLLESRIQKRLKVKGLTDASQYLRIIELDLNGEELVHLIDSVSTNTTFFWREAEHFQVFGEILDTYKKEQRTDISIWCAASSTGQEPYTLAMEAIDHTRTSNMKTRILATDVSVRVLESAITGEYSEEEVSKLPNEKRHKFFTKIRALNGTKHPSWSVNDPVRQLVLFKKLNLVNFPYPLKGPMDVIFCRNVMIYFDIKTRQKIINEFHRLLSPGGFLFLSLSESLLGIEHSFTKFSTSVFRKSE